MPKLLFKIDSEDWEKALSFDTEIFTNGIFKVFSNCFPFSRRGNFTPVNIIAQASGTINTNKTIRVILPVFTGSLRQFYVWADDGKVYLYDAANVSDVSAQIIQGSAVLREAAVFKAQIIYATNTGVMANVIPLSSGSDVFILGGLSSNPHPFVVGADRNGYLGNGNNVAKITSLTATTFNSTAVATSLETGYIVRKLINNGRYLVWIADNASTINNFPLKNSCVVAFWDMAKSTFDQIYEFQDSYIAGAEIIGDIIKIITPSGVYHTNIETRPRLVVPFDTVATTINSSAVPQDFHSVANYRQNFLMWGAGYSTAGNSPVYSLGNALYGKVDRLFQHFTATGFSISALATDNNNVIVAISPSPTASGVKLYTLNVTATETAIANVAGISLDRPYTFDHARVVLRSPIASGNSVSLKLLTSAGTKTIKASETKTNSTDSGEKNLIFDHTSAGSGDVLNFDEISDIELTTNVDIKSLEIWGDPIDDRSS